ncbi:MAG: hypothetical protein ACTSRW_01740 [Candidatus Helarchaeota archaeon]
MDQYEFQDLCEKYLPICAIFFNPLKEISAPEVDDEHNSLYIYTPKYFDRKRKPTHMTIRNAFRVCFTDGDWLQIGQDLFVTRRKLKKERLTFLSSVSTIDQLRFIEPKIDQLISHFDEDYNPPTKNRFILKEREAKIILGSKHGIYIYSFPEGDDDQIIFGFIESLKSFSQEYALTEMLNQKIVSLDSPKQSDEIKISNKILEIQASIPISENLVFSVFHFNPDDIYDEINKRTVDIARSFFRDVLRRNNLLHTKFTSRTDIFKDAFQAPIYGSVSAETLLKRVQKYGDEILFEPLLSEVFRELTRELQFPPDLEIFLLNGLNANMVAVDFHHSTINEDNLIDLSTELIESLTIYRSKVNRVISSKNINSALLDFGEKRCRVNPIKYDYNIRNMEISAPTLETYIGFAGSWEVITKYEEPIEFMIGILKRGVIPFSDAIHLRPYLDENGQRTTRKVRINKDLIQLPDFSFLTPETRSKLRQVLHEKMPDLIERPLDTMLKIIDHAKNMLNLQLR